MKANDGSGNNPERDKWETPHKLWDELNKQYEFTFDVCASEENSKTEMFCTDFELCKKGSFFAECCWMNPPFSKSYYMFKHFFNVVERGVAIYKCDNMETKVWQDVILKHANWIFIPKGRICYEGMKGSGSRFPSALIGVGVPIPELKDGVVLRVYR